MLVCVPRDSVALVLLLLVVVVVRVGVVVDWLAVIACSVAWSICVDDISSKDTALDASVKRWYSKERRGHLEGRWW